jgi:hypothetical protein
VAEGLMVRSRGNDTKPEAGTVAGDEPLPEWERELLEGQAAAVPAAAGAAQEGTAAETAADEAAVPAQGAAPEQAPEPGFEPAALAGVGIETTADEQIGALEEPIATDAITPDGVPAGQALGTDTAAENA